ncbi:MAG: Hsp20/alpha crystallin family protein [Ruthenibacterium sp.]
MFELLPYVHKNYRISNYNPFRELEKFEKSFFQGDSIGEFKTDIKDNGDSYLLEADLPGFCKEDITVDIDDNYLTISACRHSEAEETDKKDSYIRCERSYGSFSRSFDISNVKAADIKAAYENGVLRLTMPKLEDTPAATRRLEIE